MLELQGELNATLDPDWRILGIPWLRLVVTEGGHALSLLGPEHEDLDMQRLHAQVVGIWHLILSETLVQYDAESESFLSRYPQTNLGWGFDGYATRCYDVVDLSPEEHWELLVGLAALRAPLYQIVMVFRTILVDVGMSIEKLHAAHRDLTPAWWLQRGSIKAHCNRVRQRTA